MCILCADGNDLPEGEKCVGCGRTGINIMFHATPNQELCLDGKAHDFKGGVEIDGGRGWTTVCTKCGLDAFTHSMRYGL